MQLDAKDRKILQALDQDVRSSFSKIGKYARISKEVAQYRVKQLQKRGIITNFWAIPRIGTGNRVYKLLLKNRSLSSDKKKEFIDFCVGNKAVSWFAQTEGNWDFVVSSYVRDDTTFSEFAISLLDRFGSYFKEKQIVKATGLILLNEKYLYDTPIAKVTEDSFLKPIEKIDSRDQAIIRMLANNARASFTYMAKELGITAEAVRARFKTIMQRKLIIGMNPRISHEKIGLQYYHLFISIRNYGARDTLLKFYQQHPKCVFLMKHIGCYDLHLELVMKHDEVESVIDELALRFGSDIESYELLRIQKEHLMIVTR